MQFPASSITHQLEVNNKLDREWLRMGARVYAQIQTTHIYSKKQLAIIMFYTKRARSQPQITRSWLNSAVAGASALNKADQENQLHKPAANVQSELAGGTQLPALPQDDNWSGFYYW